MARRASRRGGAPVSGHPAHQRLGLPGARRRCRARWTPESTWAILLSREAAARTGSATGGGLALLHVAQSGTPDIAFADEAVGGRCALPANQAHGAARLRRFGGAWQRRFRASW
jgi:hypothetical protein